MTKLSLITYLLLFSFTNSALAMDVHSLAKKTILTAYQKLQKEGRLNELSPEFIKLHANLNAQGSKFDNHNYVQVLKEALSHVSSRIPAIVPPAQ